MPNGYPSPYGKREGDARSDPDDPRVLQVGTSGPVAWPTFTGRGDGEMRRIAKRERPLGPDEIHDQMWGRPAHKRTPWPAVGQRCRFVRDEWGDPEPATVLDVQDPADTADPNISHPVFVNGLPQHTAEGEEIRHRRPDPAPWVILQTDDGFVTQTRESRVRGSAGWLPW